MHLDVPPAEKPSDPQGSPWYSGLSRYQWFVLAFAAAGWLFDTMDQQLFNLARKPAIEELIRKSGEALTPEALNAKVTDYAGYATAIFMIGWAIGGLIFGIVGDRYGRAKTMLATIVIYSAFTGLSALSTGVWDFAFYRFLTGLGVGGEFAVGVALVAEVMPDRARPFALGWLQALSAVGNMMAAGTGIVLGLLVQEGYLESSWRAMFLIGTAPALLVVLIGYKLKEPERWTELARAAKAGTAPKLGSIRELFGDPTWRKHAIVGMLLAFAGVVGLWGIGFFSFDLIRTVFTKEFKAEGLTDAQIGSKLAIWVGIASMLQNAGGFFGVYFYSRITHHIGRRPAFLIGFILAMGSTAFTFFFLNSFNDILWMIPLMGFCQLILFGGYAIYLPELFPTRLRSTGTSFCYNVGRLVAALGPIFLSLLATKVYSDYGIPDSLRYAGVTMCSVYVIGLVALNFAPETRGKPLPE